MKSYNCKLIYLGDYVKVVRYGKEIQRGDPIPKRKIPKKDKNVMRKGIVNKTRGLKNDEIDRFLHLVNINFKVGDLFITLTYEQENIAFDKASKDFENWIKKLRCIYGDFKYIAVRSFQERGTIHYHLLVNIPRLSKEEIKNNSYWKYGNAFVKKIYSLDIVYSKSPLVKYLVKNLREFKSDERAFGKRLFLKSKNLREPQVIKGNHEELIKKHFHISNSDFEKVDEKRFNTKYMKEMEVQIYKKVNR